MALIKKMFLIILLTVLSMGLIYCTEIQPIEDLEGIEEVVAEPATYSHYFYYSNYYDNTISAYSMNTNTGEITELSGSPFSVQASPINMCASPDGRFLFVQNYSTHKLSVYATLGDGSISEINGSPFDSTQNPYRCDVSPDGKFLYVTHYSSTVGSISAWSINSSTGGLTQISGSPFSTDSYPYSITLSHSGNYLYAGHFGTKIRGWAINKNTGGLTELPNSPFNNTYTAMDLITDSNDQYLYTIQSSFGRIGKHSINQSTGDLGAESGSNNNYLHYRRGCMTPNNKYLYGIDGDGSIVTHSVNSDGSLNGIDTKSLSSPYNCAVSENGLFLFVSSLSADYVRTYSINSATGLLSELGQSPITTGDSPRSPLFVKRQDE